MLTARLDVRVEWSHCDPAGIIFNPNYYVWMDAASHSLINASGFDFFGRIGSPEFKGCPLVSSEMQFQKPLYPGEIVTIVSQVVKFGNSSFEVEHAFERDGDVVARGFERRVWAGVHPDDPRRMKGVPVPDEVRKALSETRTVNTTLGSASS